MFRLINVCNSLYSQFKQIFRVYLFRDQCSQLYFISLGLTVSWRRSLSYRNQSIDLQPIQLTNQWTGFYMKRATTMKELSQRMLIFHFAFKHLTTSIQNIPCYHHHDLYHHQSEIGSQMFQIKGKAISYFHCFGFTDLKGRECRNHCKDNLTYHSCLVRVSIFIKKERTIKHTLTKS